MNDFILFVIDLIVLVGILCFVSYMSKRSEQAKLKDLVEGWMLEYRDKTIKKLESAKMFNIRSADASIKRFNDEFDVQYKLALKNNDINHFKFVMDEITGKTFIEYDLIMIVETAKKNINITEFSKIVQNTELSWNKLQEYNNGTKGLSKPYPDIDIAIDGKFKFVDKCIDGGKLLDAVEVINMAVKQVEEYKALSVKILEKLNTIELAKTNAYTTLVSAENKILSDNTMDSDIKDTFLLRIEHLKSIYNNESDTVDWFEFYNAINEVFNDVFIYINKSQN